MAEVKFPLETSMAIFTIVSNNYLHFARTLLKTVVLHNPEADVYCVIVDQDLGPASDFSNEFSILCLDDLQIPDVKQMAFQYDILEFNTAVKPWAFEALLRRGYENVIYLDPDIYLYRPLRHVTDALLAGSDIVITPHLLSSIKDDKRPNELDIRRAGTYNLGFCAIKQSKNSLDFLHWWQNKLYRECINDQDRGIFVDQSWIDLVPGLFDKVFILRNPAYNVAYWNIAQRSVRLKSSGDWTVEGEPLVFFHFSGFNPLNPRSFSKYQNRFTLANLGPAATLAKNYASALIANGAKTYAKIPYDFAKLSDGTTISKALRRVYLKNDILRTKMGNDPFCNAEFLADSAQGIKSILPISWLMYCVYQERHDLQSRYNLMEPSEVTAFWDWFVIEQSNELSDRLRELHQLMRTAIFQHDSILRTEKVYASVALCHEVFSLLLGRSPTQPELDRLGRMFGSKIGASVALMITARTTESRNSPRPTRRLKKALYTIWRTAKALPEQPFHVLKRTSRSAQPQELKGVYTPELDGILNGVWCAPQVTVPLHKGEHCIISIKGNYYPLHFERMNGRKALTLDLLLDGKLWRSIVLPESGEIDIAAAVPEQLSHATVLQINADRSFVPLEIDQGVDERKLSWRLEQILVDDAVIFDCQR